MESLVLHLRDALVAKIKSNGGASDSKLEDWRLKTVRERLSELLAARRPDFGRELSERYSAFFMAASDQVRMVRNDAGHPTSVDPISEPVVHANLLLFPEFLSLVANLIDWVKTTY